MSRTTLEDLTSLAIEDLAAALEHPGLEVNRSCPDVDLVAVFDGRTVLIEVKAVAHATPERAARLVGARPDVEATPILVADRITEGARQLLTEAGWGWFDRRGHISLRAPGLMIDRDVPVAARKESQVSDPISGQSGRSVAYALLRDPTKPLPVRSSASRLGISPASISGALARLRDAALLDGDGLPLKQDLFWSLADVWRPARTWLARAPASRDWAKAHDPEAAGWRLSGTRAAAAWGAPVAATEGPPDLYVPGPIVVSIAARRLGETVDPLRAKASIAVAPVGLVTADRSFKRRSRGWLLAHPLVVALDLALDVGRGREILESWEPPKEFTRVW